MFAADVQHRAQRNSTQRNVIAHVQEQAVQMLPQLHRLHSKQGHIYTEVGGKDCFHHKIIMMNDDDLKDFFKVPLVWLRGESE